MAVKRITLLEDCKTYEIGSEEAFKKFLESRETSCLVCLETRERVSSFASLVPGGTYYCYKISGTNNTKTLATGDKATFIDMLIKLTHQHWREYQYEKARVAFELVLSHQRKYFGEEEDHHPDIVTTHLHLGTLKALQGDSVGGIESFQQAQALGFKVFGTLYHPKVAEIYNATGNLLSHSGRPRDALNMYRCALAIQAKVFGKESEYFAHACSCCGLALEQLGRYQDALKCHQKALSIALTFHYSGNYRLKVAQIHCNIASTLNRQGQYREARKHYHEALFILQNVVQ